MKAAAVVSEYMLKLARPLFWHIGAMYDGPLRGATTFILRFEKRHFAVTADHVLAQYFDARRSDARTICQIGECQVWPETTLIGRSAKLDIATFEIDPVQLRAMGAEPFDCRKDWPPINVEDGDSLSLAGYLDSRRRVIRRGHREHEAWGAHGIVDAVSDREIITIYDPAKAFAADGVAMPPLGFNMSGCSGGPAILLKDVNGLLRTFPVGLIFKGSNGKAEGAFADFDRIHVRKLHFIQPDGKLAEPDSGWLPR
ncbi:hypothetical protein QRQ56_23330 [Bradyrhizobium sp. U531]|uniref:hypothetical protein n=1 Tax=Bradyrhizobium sp. U531 TaxID=3053458 RepID=UPI003F439D5E